MEPVLARHFTIDAVCSADGVADQLACRRVLQTVSARASHHRVSTCATAQPIIPVIALERVAAIAAKHRVVTATTVDGVVACASIDEIRSGSTGQVVVARQASERDVRRRTARAVLSVDVDPLVRSQPTRIERDVRQGRGIEAVIAHHLDIPEIAVAVGIRRRGHRACECYGVVTAAVSSDVHAVDIADTDAREVIGVGRKQLNAVLGRAVSRASIRSTDHVARKFSGCAVANPVSSRPAFDGVSATAAAQPVVAVTAQNGVVTGPAHDAVIARARVDEV